MKARDLLQGKPLKMPLHVLIVHFPIALFTLSVLLDISNCFMGRNVLVRGAFYTLEVGLICAAVAAIPGLADYTSIRKDHPARVTATWHLALNVAAVILYAISLGMRWGHLEMTTAPIAPFVLSIAAFILIGISGYLGGVLVYDDGIGVGRHRRATLPKRTREIAGSADASGFTPVVNENELREGQTLRVDLGGTIVTMVRLEGEVFAFQEYCTHRHGPLSEGCFADGQVQCPWHNSRFDVRSGAVTQGPAKMNLKVFATQVRDGRIWVQSPAPLPPASASAARRERQPGADSKEPPSTGNESAEPKLQPDQRSSSQREEAKRPAQW